MEATPERWAEIGAYIVDRREFFEMDQKDLVAKSKVSQSVVSRLENGHPQNNRVSVKNLRQLAKALVMYPDALMDMTRRYTVAEVHARVERWWDEVEAAGGVEEFYDDLSSSTYSSTTSHPCSAARARQSANCLTSVSDSVGRGLRRA